jgi:RNA polymerase-binding protein DksA
MDLTRARRRLEEEKNRLLDLRRQAELGEARATQESLVELSSYEQHLGDQGSDTFEREQSLSLVEQIEASLGEIDRALKRVSEGTYGSCEACGLPIGEERLEARPATRYCVDDQARSERESLPPA